MQTSVLVNIGVVFLAAGLVKGVSGMGLPTLSMALLGLTMPPSAAAALMVLPSLITNLAQCAGTGWRNLARRLWPMWAALALFTVFSPLPDLGSLGPLAPLGLGLILTTYALWGLTKPVLPDLSGAAWPVDCAVGALSGILTAATGVFVMPLVPYLQSLSLSKDALVQALGLSFTVATLALAARLGRTGLASLSPDVLACVVATLAALIGLWAGTMLRGCMQPAAFQRALLGVTMLLGIVMVVRSW